MTKIDQIMESLRRDNETFYAILIVNGRRPQELATNQLFSTRDSALSFAAKLSDKTRKAVSVCSVSPIAAFGSEWTAR